MHIYLTMLLTYVKNLLHHLFDVHDYHKTLFLFDHKKTKQLIILFFIDLGRPYLKFRLLKDICSPLAGIEWKIRPKKPNLTSRKLLKRKKYVMHK